jgi:diguanylate cyclase (GGDEF)-like protein
MEKPLALIVEDEPDIAALYRHVLDMAGYRTEIAFHGQVAVERLSNSQPVIVILDLVLPGVSGKEILGLIQQDERLSQTKVIVVTAHAHIAGSLSVEPDLVLFKPIGMEQFTDLIERFHLKVQFQTTIPIEDEPWDRVTGLYNQTFFANRLEISLRQLKENDQYSFAILSINLDQDDSIKSKLNIKHWISILRETAKTLKTTVNSTDTVARFDQDNFYLLIENVPDKDSLKTIAMRIHEKLNRNLADIGNNIHFPIKIGILLCDGSYENIVEQIQRDANIAQALKSVLGGVSNNYLGQASARGNPV